METSTISKMPILHWSESPPYDTYSCWCFPLKIISEDLSFTIFGTRSCNSNAILDGGASDSVGFKWIAEISKLKTFTSTVCTQSHARKQGTFGFLLFLPLHSTFPQSWHGRRQYATSFFPGQSSSPHFWHVLFFRILRGGSACFKSSPTRFREAVDDSIAASVSCAAFFVVSLLTEPFSCCVVNVPLVDNPIGNSESSTSRSKPWLTSFRFGFRSGIGGALWERWGSRIWSRIGFRARRVADRDSLMFVLAFHPL